MRMNKRKGFKRLAIVIGVPYFFSWGLVGVSNYRAWLKYEPMAIEASRKHSPDAEMYWNMSGRAYEMWGMAVWYGVIWPVIALVLAGIAFWVYRGFKPKQDQ